MQKKISIIIVTYNSQAYITNCFISIIEFLDIAAEELEVLVIDNSTGCEAKEMKKLVEGHDLYKIISVQYIHNSANLGYGQGNNVGIKHAKGDIICIMNPDVRFGSKILKDIADKFRNENLALQSYRQIGGFNYSFYIKPEFRNKFTGVLTKMANKIDIFNSKYFYLSGAFFFVKKEIFIEIGLFDENIFMYYEEPDIAKRIEEKNYEICYDNSKFYYHLVGDRKEWSEKSFNCEINSLKYYLNKFNFNIKKIVNSYIKEYRVKIIVAKILNDYVRVSKFKKEEEQIKNIFNF